MIDQPDQLGAETPRGLTTPQRYWIRVDHPSCGYECCGGGAIEAEEDNDGEWMKATDVFVMLEGIRQIVAEQGEMISRIEPLAQAAVLRAEAAEAALSERTRERDDDQAYMRRLVDALRDKDLEIESLRRAQEERR